MLSKIFWPPVMRLIKYLRFSFAQFVRWWWVAVSSSESSSIILPSPLVSLVLRLLGEGCVPPFYRLQRVQQRQNFSKIVSTIIIPVSVDSLLHSIFLPSILQRPSYSCRTMSRIHILMKQLTLAQSSSKTNLWNIISIRTLVRVHHLQSHGLLLPDVLQCFSYTWIISTVLLPIVNS